MPKHRQPVVIVEGSGAVVRDVEGKEYIDLFAGYAAVNVGHVHREVVKAVTYWVSRIHHTSYDYYNIPSAVLAEELVKILPMRGEKKVFFCVSGAEANEGALKLARKYALKSRGRPGLEVLSLRYSFHGRTHLTAALTGQSKYKKGMASLSVIPGVKVIPAPYCYRSPVHFSDPTECGEFYAYMVEDVIRFETSGDVGAFIAEPVLGEGGIIVPPKNYFRIVKKILEDHGALFIADEVQTGFGRTGRWFGIENFDVEPDVVTMAKGLTSGLPLGAIGARAEVANSFEPGDHSSTWGPNVVSTAAAVAVIKVLKEEKLHERARVLGEYFMKGLKEIQEENPLVGDVRGLGLMIGVELVSDVGRKTPAVKEALEVRERMREKGFLIGVGGAYGSTLRIEPPLLISKEQIDKALTALNEVLREVR